MILILILIHQIIIASAVALTMSYMQLTILYDTLKLLGKEQKLMLRKSKADDVT
jgi:hypothetical protein